MNLFFQKELPQVVSKYPNLSIKNDKGTGFLKGIIDVSTKNDLIIGNFSVEIHSTGKFPYRFPKLYEVGGDIPCEADWHKYSDNSCCFTVEPEEILICKNGITLIQFIEDIAIPYFANQIYRKQEGNYLREYPHDNAGIRMFYSELFKSENINFWIKCFKNAFNKNEIRRNDKCYCNSGSKYKKCHQLVEEKIQILGKDRVLSDIKTLAL